MKIVRLTLAVLAAYALTSCQLPRQEVVRQALFVQPSDSTSSPLYVWHGIGQPGPVRVTIDLSEQKAYIFRDTQPVAWSYVATGTSGHRTPTGSFVITEKVVNKRSNRYGSLVDANGNVIHRNATAGVHSAAGGSFQGAKMPYWMRLTDYGVGMHAGPIPNPGSPASHGCIRLPYTMAQHLYDVAPSGTRVTIVP